MSRRALSKEASTGSELSPGSQALLEPISREFQDLGLSPYEARVLVALLRLGSATTVELARISDVPRTSIYQVLDGLSARGLSERVPSDGPAMWTSPGHAEVLDRLDVVHERKLKQAKQRTLRLREQLADVLADAPDPVLPQVRIIPKASQTKAVFERILEDAAEEILAFSRPPYAWYRDMNDAVLAALARGVRVRAIYPAEHPADIREEARRTELAYLEAGVEARVLDEVPIKLIVADRKVALVAFPDEERPGAYPANLLVEHDGFAALQAQAFEQSWANAELYPVTKR